MNKNSLLTVAIALIAVVLNSCNTPTGQGAAAGAIGGAVVGGPVGAAVGAAGGAIVGAVIEENQAAQYGPVPTAGYPRARSTATPGMYASPYTGRVYDLRNVPHGSLVRDADTNRLFRKP
jgi:predicted small secreted protein